MAEDKHFLDKHRDELIQRVNNTAAILDELLSENVIQQHNYDKIRALPTSQEIMRELFNQPLASSGDQGKETFYKILNKHESYLIDDLKRTEYENPMKVETVMVKKMLLGTSSRRKEKQRSSLIQRVETMTSVIKLLLETLADLRDGELRELLVFQRFLYQIHSSNIQWRLLMTADMQDTVFFMVLINGQQSVETTKKVLEKMERTDLVQTLSESSSGSKKKQSVDERLSALIHKVATMRAVKELLLETLSDLSNDEFEKFKVLLQFTFFQRSLELISWKELSLPDILWSELSPLHAASGEVSPPHTSWSERSFLFASQRRQINMKGRLVDMMLKKCGQQSVEVTMEVLTDMNRTDLMQRLSETSSGHKAAGSSAEAFGVSTTQGEKHCVDEHWPALIQKVETMTSVIEQLLETLVGLSDGELGTLKRVLQTQTNLHTRFSDSTLRPLEIEDRQVIVFLMVLTYGQQSVEKTEEVLKEMTRTDLVQRLSHSSSQSKKKRLDEHRSALIQKVATMAVVKQLLLETLNSLSDQELKEFKKFLMWIIHQKKLKAMSSPISLTKDRAEIVDLMLQTYSQQSVSLTREAVKKMNRTDLMQRLSKPSSEHEEKHSVDEHQTAVLEKADVKQILLETLKDLSSKELKKIKWLLQFTQFQKGLPRTSWKQLYWAGSAKALVDLMVQSCGQQSVEVTKEVFMDMNRADLVISSSMKATSHAASSSTAGFSTPPHYLTTSSETQPESAALRKYWTKKPREAAAEGPSLISPPLAEESTSHATSSSTAGFSTPPHYLTTSSETQPESGPSGSSELEGCGSATQDSSDWTKLDPEVNCTDADEAPIYSLQSEAGNFECSVSGVRWVCKEKVSFKYQFCSLSGHMEKIESMQYMPAGPLMDITAIAGKLDVVYLPHWIAIDDNPTILDKFAVLHIDDCGDVVERVSEVTSSHVKLSEPVFSLKLILLKYLGLSVEIHCKVLMYKADTPSLKLHVYLIPPDPALIRELEGTLSRDGYKRIHEPHPVKPLKMHEWFALTADLDGAKIHPEALMLIYESTEPNFFQVLCIKNPDTNFALELKQKNELQPVWTCEIQKDEWQSTGHIQAAESSAGPCDSATASAERSSEPGPSYKKHQTAAITAEGKKLLNALDELGNEEFKAFKWHLQCIKKSQREKSDRFDVVILMLQTYTQEESVKVAKDIFKEIQRNDLVHRLSDTSSGSECKLWNK